MRAVIAPYEKIASLVEGTASETSGGVDFGFSADKPVQGKTQAES